MLYLNTQTGKVLYGEDGKATEAVNSDNIPGLTFGDVKTLALQLLNSESVDETSALYDDLYAGYSGKTVTASAVVDIDYVAETPAPVATAITHGVAIATIDLAYTPAETIVRTHGKIYLGSDRGESVYYNNCVLKSAGVYTFTLADSSYASANFTPTEDYALAATAYVRTAALIEVPNSSFVITAATGLFSMSLDGSNSVLWDAIKNTSGISTAKLEVQIFINGIRDRTITVDFILTGTMSLGGIAIATPSRDDFSQLDGRYAQLAGANDIEITDASKGLIIKDRSTGTRYRIMIEDGEFTKEIVS